MWRRCLIRDDQPRPTEVGRCCRCVPSPGPRLMQGACFPGYPTGPPRSQCSAAFCGAATCKRRACSRLASSRYQASSIACRCCSKRWRVAGDNCWYSRRETSKLSIVTETKFCLCLRGSKRSRTWRSVAGTQHEVPIGKVEGILQISKKKIRKQALVMPDLSMNNKSHHNSYTNVLAPQVENHM